MSTFAAYEDFAHLLEEDVADEKAIKEKKFVSKLSSNKMVGKRFSRP